jgi:adenosine 3'-phospho 5'-phosphosulfate transporter B2
MMMFGMNLFTVLSTTVTLVSSGAMAPAVAFMVRHPLFAAHVLGNSVCSTVGQLFIFHVIGTYGPWKGNSNSFA